MEKVIENPKVGDSIYIIRNTSVILYTKYEIKKIIPETQFMFEKIEFNNDSSKPNKRFVNTEIGKKVIWDSKEKMLVYIDKYMNQPISDSVKQEIAKLKKQKPFLFI